MRMLKSLLIIGWMGFGFVLAIPALIFLFITAKLGIQ